MKRVICLIFLIGVISGIVMLTKYTLNNKELRNETKEKIVNKTEQVTSNISGNNLSEIYNIFLNKEKHKMKLSYNVILKNNNLADIDLIIYFDGVEIFNDLIGSDIEGNNIEYILARDDVLKYVKINLSDIEVITSEEIEYMVLNIGYLSDSLKEKYYVFNNEGKLLDKEGFLIKDTSKRYLKSNGEELEIFYENTDEQKLAKITDNTIYYIKEKKNKEKDNLKLIEYKCKINDKKLESEKIQEIEDVIIKEETTEE